MAEHVIKLPDVGEGVAEAELVEWHVKPGELVREDTVLAAVMTDKATVEIPSPVDGEIVWLGAEVGDMVAVGSALVRLKVAGSDGEEAPAAEATPVIDKTQAEPGRAAASGDDERAAPPPPPQPLEPAAPVSRRAPRAPADKPLASPAVRLSAREAGVDLRQVSGSGPAGRITHDDLEAFLTHGPARAGASALSADDTVEEIKVVGLRRRIAEKMALAKARIPHITYVEEVDVGALETLRAGLNKDRRAERPRLTLLPFLMRAMVKAIAEQPALNARYDDEAGVVHRYGGVHIGIATQTAAGLMVPVVRHAEARDLWSCAAELDRLSQASRAGSAAREELSGSTITITSLGPLGGIVTTPVINHPEVAIVGVNKIAVRPAWDGTQFVPAKMMNLSCSFDHRIIDGYDAALFVQRLKSLLETPAMIFIGG